MHLTSFRFKLYHFIRNISNLLFKFRVFWQKYSISKLHYRLGIQALKLLIYVSFHAPLMHIVKLFKPLSSIFPDFICRWNIVQDLLFSYNIAVDRSDEMKKILKKSAASVGLQLPDVYQPWWWGLFPSK